MINQIKNRKLFITYLIGHQSRKKNLTKVTIAQNVTNSTQTGYVIDEL